MSKDASDRGLHFLRIFEEGKQFTAEIIRENETLRLTNLKLREELRDTQEKLSRLQELEHQMASVEAENREFAERYVRIEKQNGDLASLYVATYNLHATLNPQEVVRSISEIVINLIGSETFGVYAVENDGKALRLLTHEGLDEKRHQTLPLAGLTEEALRTGRAVAMERTNGDADLAAPMAVAPLIIHERPLGVIAIYKLLAHKAGLEAIDRELLDLLAGHAATALYSSKLFAQAERKLTTLQGFLDLLRKP